MLRNHAQECCVVFGSQLLGNYCAIAANCVFEATSVMRVFLSIVTPGIRGELPGGDTASQRCNYIRVMTYVLQGFVQFQAKYPTAIAFLTQSKHANNVVDIIYSIADSISQIDLYNYSEIYLAESIVLLLRMLFQQYGDICYEMIHVKEKMLLAYILLMGFPSNSPHSIQHTVNNGAKDENISASSIYATSASYNHTLTGGSMGLVSQAAYSDLVKFCTGCYNRQRNVDNANSVAKPDVVFLESVYSPYFCFVIGSIINGSQLKELSVLSNANALPRAVSAEHQKLCLHNLLQSNKIEIFMSITHLKNSFECLIRLLPNISWTYYQVVIPVLVYHTIPPVGPAPMPPIPPNASMAERNVSTC